MTVRWSLATRASGASLVLLASLPGIARLGVGASGELPPGPPDLAAVFRALDVDGDGSLGRYEAAEAMLSLHAAADANRDGAVGLAELEALLRLQVAEANEEIDEVFAELDGDQDGKLVLDTLPRDLVPFLAAADLDGDGAVTRREILEARPFDSAAPFIEAEFLGLLGEFDADGDGAFGMKDVPADFRESFEELDLDGDGSVTEAELRDRVAEELAGATFRVTGDKALMEGVIGATTPARVLELILEHPEVETIAMGEVPGSMDDEANLRAALWVHRAGLRTEVVPGGEIASGGVDFFLAGRDRTLGQGARVGVHSWAGMDETGDELPRDHPEHAKYLDFYRAVGTEADFYWFTLEAAPADDIHWMTADELQQFGVGAAMVPVGASGGTEVEPEVEAEDELASGQSTDRRTATHVGGCVLRKADGPVPGVMLATGQLVRADRFAPFAASLTSHGIEFRAEAGVTDAFLGLVARTLSEMFPAAEGLDRGAQSDVVRAMYQRRALLPVPKTERSFERLFSRHPDAIEELEASHSVCDIIMAETGEGLVMEVVEHLLHTVTDVGLHATYPKVWGLDRESTLWSATQRAIELGHFDISGYDDLDGETPAVRDRILMQEFAYWYITTRWDIQARFGPDEEEWGPRTPAELRAAFPGFEAAYARTAGRVLACPTSEVLEALAAAGGGVR